MQETPETRVWSVGGADPLEKEMASHSSILAWKMPWTGETDRLQSMGLQRVWHDWTTESTRTKELLNKNKKGSILYYTCDPVAYPPSDPASKANEWMEVFFVLMCSCRQIHILTWKDQFQWQERQFWKDVELCKTPAKWHENILGNQPNLPNDLSSWASSFLVSMPFQLKIKQI